MRIHFNLRDLFWLTLVAAMGVAWFIDHKRTTESAADKFSSLQVESMILRGQSRTLNSETQFDGMPIVRQRKQTSVDPGGMPIMLPPNRMSQ